MEKLLPQDIYSIDDTPTRIEEGNGVKHIIHDAGYDLEDLNTYKIVDIDYVVSEKATLRDYDRRFAAKLCSYQKVQKDDTPPYIYFRVFLEHHYQKAKKKIAYLAHIQKEVIPRYRDYFDALPPEYFQEIINWFNQIATPEVVEQSDNTEESTGGQDKLRGFDFSEVKPLTIT